LLYLLRDVSVFCYLKRFKGSTSGLSDMDFVICLVVFFCFFVAVVFLLFDIKTIVVYSLAVAL